MKFKFGNLNAWHHRHACIILSLKIGKFLIWRSLPNLPNHHLTNIFSYTVVPYFSPKVSIISLFGAGGVHMHVFHACNGLHRLRLQSSTELQPTSSEKLLCKGHEHKINNYAVLFPLYYASRWGDVHVHSRYDFILHATVQHCSTASLSSLTCLPVGSMNGLGLYLRVGYCDQYNGIDPRVWKIYNADIFIFAVSSK